MVYRRELRTVCHGEVQLFIEGRPSPLVAQLKDVSARGFGAKHGEIGLTHGVEVEFVHEFLSGKARVIWSRIADGAIESGFLLLR